MSGPKEERKRLQSHIQELQAKLEEARLKEKGYVWQIKQYEAERALPEQERDAAKAALAEQDWMRPRLAEYMAATYRYAVRGVEELKRLNADTAYRLNE